MRLVLSTALLLGLTGCPGSDKDTGDSTGTTGTDDTGTTGTTESFGLLRGDDGMVFPVGASGDCANNSCVYTMTTTTEASLLTLDMTETGDDSGGTQWTEQHTGFALDSENADGSFTYKLVLAAVASFEDVVANSTTLFYADSVLAGTTWYFGATSLDGLTTDCVVTGEDVGYYSSWCTYSE